MMKQGMGFGKHHQASNNKEEISSITRQIEELSKSPPAPKRPPQLPEKAAEVARDENENQQFEKKSAGERKVIRPVVPQPMAPRKSIENRQNLNEVERPPDKKDVGEVGEKKELDSRPKLIDEKAATKNSFGSREFKSAFNGPRGQYGSLADRALGGPSVPTSEGPKVQKEPTVHPTQKLPEVPARVVPSKVSEASPASKTMSPKPSSPQPTTQSLASKAEISQPVARPEMAKPLVAEQWKSSQSQKPAISSETIVAPAADSPIAETPKAVLPVSLPVSSPAKSPIAHQAKAAASSEKSPEEMPVTDSPASSTETETPLPPVPKETLEAEVDPVVKKILVTEDEDEDIGRTYQRTKSQEFRDYQQEFVLTSTIDFGPLSSPLPTRKPSTAPSVSSAPLKRCKRCKYFLQRKEVLFCKHTIGVHYGTHATPTIAMIVIIQS